MFDIVNKNKELFITWICDYIETNFKNTNNVAFIYQISTNDWFLYDWKTIDEDLENEISKRTGLNFNINFSKINMELRGRLIKIGGKENEI